MNKKLWSNIILIISLALLLSACAAGKKYFQLSQQLQSAGKYKEAIAYLEQALAKEPKNKKMLAFGCGCLILLCACGALGLVALDLTDFIDLGLPILSDLQLNF